MTQDALALQLGISRAQLANYESNRTDPPPTITKKLSRLWEVAEGWFWDGGELEEIPTKEPKIISQSSSIQSAERVPPQLLRLNAEATGRIKVYGPISAGGGNVSSIDQEELDVPVQFSRQDFGALIVQGDSMLPFLHPSDIVIFKDWYAEKPGHIVAAHTPDGDWFVKLMVYDGHQYRLRSLNGKYPDIEPPFAISGFLVGYVRDDGPERFIWLNPYGIRPD